MSDTQRPTRLSIPVSDRDRIRGNRSAPLTLVEYGDYECDYCANSEPAVTALLGHFGDRLRFVFRNFPHTNIHPHASMAAQAAEAARSQGKFWEMHDMLLAHQTQLAQADLTHYALSIGLEVYHFQADLSSQRYARQIDADYQSGVDSGVRRTPTFFINDVRFEGPDTFDAIKAALDAVDLALLPSPLPATSAADSYSGQRVE